MFKFKYGRVLYILIRLYSKPERDDALWYNHYYYVKCIYLYIVFLLNKLLPTIIKSTIK